MAVVTGLTAARMLAIEAASIVGAHVDEDEILILEKHDGGTVNTGVHITGGSGGTTVPGHSIFGDYTLVLSDAGKSIDLDAATTKVVTIPANADVAFPLGTVVEICRIGAGAVTITPAAGVTIPNRLQSSGAASRNIANQYESVSLRKQHSNVWILVGDIT